MDKVGRPLTKLPFRDQNSVGFFRKSAHGRYSKIQKMVRGLEHKGVVADIGCYGAALGPYLEEAGCNRIEGFDLDENSLSAASKVYDEVYRWDAETEVAPVDPRRYDVVIAAEIIEHLLDVDHFLNQVHSILQPAGHLIITTPNLASLNNRVRLLFGTMPFNAPALSYSTHSKGVDPAHLRIGTAREWKKVFRAFRFRVDRVEGVSLFSFLAILDKVRPTLSGSLVFDLVKE